MQRDMKVGMAVGVALIGIVGALFFRREPESKDKTSPPPLQNAEELDRRIGEKGKGPYMSGVEDFPDRVAPVPPPQNASTNSKSKIEHADVPAFATDDEAAKAREASTRKPGPAPDPIRMPEGDAVATGAGPAHNRAWEPAEPAGKKASQRSKAAGSAGETVRTHVIQSGDTLSGLASRYLGSSGRYREIYEANRNVLRSPNDLPDGATIVIPDGGKPRGPQHTAGTPGATNPSSAQSGVTARKTSARSGEPETDEPPATTAPKGDTPREKIRFVPVNRGPFSAGRAPPAAPAKSNE